MSAPTFVAAYSTGYTGVGTSKSVSVARNAGDKLVLYAMSEAGDASFGTPVLSGVTWTLVEAQGVGNGLRSEVVVWIGEATTSTTSNASLSNAEDEVQWGFTVVRFSGSAGFGAAESTNNGTGSAAPSLAITTTADNSAIVCAVADWNADDGARTWRTVNSITPTSGNGLELDYHNVIDAYVCYGAYYNDAGTAGAQTVGLTAPTGMRYVIAAVEVLGIDDSAPSEGSADVGLSLAVAGEGDRDSDGSANVGLALAMAGEGDRVSTGSANTGLGLAVAASGTRESDGSASVGVSLAVAGEGDRDAVGTANVGASLALSATGEREPSGQAAVGISLDVDGTGEREPSGQGAAQVDLSLSATSLRDSLSEVDVPIALDIFALGDAPAIGDAEGSVAVQLALDPAATGSRESAGTAAVELELAVAGTAFDPPANQGSAAVNLALDVAATGTRDAVGSADVGVALAVTAIGMFSNPVTLWDGVTETVLAVTLWDGATETQLEVGVLDP